MSEDRGAKTARFEVGSEQFVVLSVPNQVDPLKDLLTEAEFDVALQLLQGKSNNSIASHRGTSSRTVANQVAAIFRKLEVRSRTELTALLRKPSSPDSPEGGSPGSEG